MSEGDDSEYVRKTLKNLEAQAKTEKAAISALTQQAAHPIQLPTLEDVSKCIRILEDVMAADPLAGREQLGRIFEAKGTDHTCSSDVSAGRICSLLHGVGCRRTSLRVRRQPTQYRGD